MSEEQEYDLFCTHCGQRITKDTVFCPSCGMQVSGEGEAQVNNNPNDRFNVYNANGTRDMSGRLMFLSIVFIISAVIFLYEGISTYVNIDSTIDQLVASSSWPDLVQFMEDAGYTEQQFIDLIKSSMAATAIMFIVAGACMGVAAICGFTKKMYVLGLVCCIVAIVCTMVTVLGLIVGIILTYMYATTKPCFTS